MIDFIFILTMISIALPVYVYVVYPVLLYLVTRIYHRSHAQDSGTTRKVTLIVSCFNESQVIKDKINNCLNLDYPETLLEIIFVSDGSTDGTDEIIKQYTDKRIKLIRQEGRLGKTSALNLAIPQAQGELIVFSDANAMYQPDAIQKLVRNFASPEVGYVVGAAIYTDGDTNSAAASENSYWQYELAIKKMESDLHSVVGGDGAIYAIRKELYEKLDEKDINDFVNPLQIIAKGSRGIFEPEAICLEETAGDFKKEARRKERIVNRSFRGLMKVNAVLNPFKYGIFSFEVISHKLLRWLVPVFLLGIAIGSVILSYFDQRLFQLLYVLETLFLWLAIIGYHKQNKATISPLFFYPYYFLMVNYYSLIGIIKAMTGKIQVTWSSPREHLEESGLSLNEKLISAFLFITPVIIFYDFI